MKFAVSMALLFLLLAMPVSCALAACQEPPPAHPCCPASNANSKCPYDLFDAAKMANATVAVLPAASVATIAPPAAVDPEDLILPAAEDRSGLYILHRVLRI